MKRRRKVETTPAPAGEQFPAVSKDIEKQKQKKIRAEAEAAHIAAERQERRDIKGFCQRCSAGCRFPSTKDLSKLFPTC